MAQTMLFGLDVNAADRAQLVLVSAVACLDPNGRLSSWELVIAVLRLPHVSDVKPSQLVAVLIKALLNGLDVLSIPLELCNLFLCQLLFWHRLFIKQALYFLA